MCSVPSLSLSGNDDSGAQMHCSMGGQAVHNSYSHRWQPDILERMREADRSHWEHKRQTQGWETLCKFRKRVPKLDCDKDISNFRRVSVHELLSQISIWKKRRKSLQFVFCARRFKCFLFVLWIATTRYWKEWKNKSSSWWNGILQHDLKKFANFNFQQIKLSSFQGLIMDDECFSEFKIGLSVMSTRHTPLA
jgi:hypothetical protein